jgi:hypothetical protein
MSVGDLLVDALRRPEALASLDLRSWDQLIRQARSANLLGRIYLLLEARDLIGSVPAPARHHLESARTVAARHVNAVRWEVRCIQEALSEVGVSIILLKGAAYLMAGLPPAAGRLFSDIDILVPKDRLPTVEAALMLHGWGARHHSPYDQRYYRTWMHELPPMRHVTRLSVLDVHHAILPETSRLRPDPMMLREAAHPLGDGNLMVLAPADMVLHSAVHLFHDGEFSSALRDLVDLDLLLRNFTNLPGFWDEVVSRAASLHLSRPLFYALRYTGMILDTPVPAKTLVEANIGRPPRGVLQLMDILLLRGLRPRHTMCDDWLTAPSLGALYIRAHWLRMPPLLLARHLLHKAFTREDAA